MKVLLLCTVLFSYALGCREWTPVVKSVCYGAKGESYGTISLTQEGLLYGMKFEHISGQLTAHKGDSKRTMRWGHDIRNLSLIISDANKLVVFPKGVEINKKARYQLPGFNSNGNMLALFDLQTPMYAQNGTKLRLWYGEDFINWTEHDNGGKHCVKVFACYML